MAHPQLTAPRSADEALAAWLEHLAHERRLSPRTLEAYGHIGRPASGDDFPWEKTDLVDALKSAVG